VSTISSSADTTSSSNSTGSNISTGSINSTSTSSTHRRVEGPVAHDLPVEPINHYHVHGNAAVVEALRHREQLRLAGVAVAAVPVARVRQLARVANGVDVLLHHLERFVLGLGVRRVRGDEKVELLARVLVAGVADDLPRHRACGEVAA